MGRGQEARYVHALQEVDPGYEGHALADGELQELAAALQERYPSPEARAEAGGREELEVLREIEFFTPASSRLSSRLGKSFSRISLLRVMSTCT
jgi:hypothetical protein